ncbi:hypothetical protein Emag_004523 [Eimeria magna]
MTAPRSCRFCGSEELERSDHKGELTCCSSSSSSTMGRSSSMQQQQGSSRSSIMQHQQGSSSSRQQQQARSSNTKQQLLQHPVGESPLKNFVAKPLCGVHAGVGPCWKRAGLLRDCNSLSQREEALPWSVASFQLEGQGGALGLAVRRASRPFNEASQIYKPLQASYLLLLLLLLQLTLSGLEGRSSSSTRHVSVSF